MDASALDERGAGERRVSLFVLGAVAVIALAGHYGSLDCAFTNWDDPQYVLTNPYVRKLTWTNVRVIFTLPHFSNYLPLHLLSYAVEAELWGLSPKVFHTTNVALHVLNCALLFIVLRRMRISETAAMAASLIFALHPVQVESVAWISERKTLLSMTFLLAALWAYV